MKASLHNTHRFWLRTQEAVVLSTGACERRRAARELISGLGAALGRQEANWKGPEKANTGEGGEGGQDGMDDCCCGCQDVRVCVRE